MKKLLVVTMLLTIVLTLASCSKKEETGFPEGMTYSENDAVDFMFFYPEDWTLDRNDGMVSARVSDKDHSNVSVTVFTSPEGVVDIEGYLKDTYLGYVKENFPDLEMLSENEKTTLGGVDARQNVFSATVAGEKYQFLQVITYRYGYIYILTYTSTAEGFDSHTEEVQKIIKEFKFN
ncbi:MAG: DUF1795 domain-containing protein [Ruminococcaceae bacterium]|nr:DUF1795 domain-containing protein [Oscillospiraceae bacterium]